MNKVINVYVKEFNADGQVLTKSLILNALYSPRRKSQRKRDIHAEKQKEILTERHTDRLLIRYKDPYIQLLLIQKKSNKKSKQINRKTKKIYQKQN